MTMFLIEPCCTQRHIPALRAKLGENGTQMFHGYGDLSVEEMLPVILMRYSEADLLFVAPALPDHITQLLSYWMRHQWMRVDGKGKVNTIGHLTLVTDLREAKSPMAAKWLKENPFKERLTLKDTQQEDTAIVLPDIAFYGAINLCYGSHFTAIATKDKTLIRQMRDFWMQ